MRRFHYLSILLLVLFCSYSTAVTENKCECSIRTPLYFTLSVSDEGEENLILLRHFHFLAPVNDGGVSIHEAKKECERIKTEMIDRFLCK